MRKVDKIIDDIDEFIRNEMEIVRQKEMLEINNLPPDLKAEANNTNDTGPKQETNR